MLDMFDDKYIATLGTKVTKKEMIIDHPTQNGKVDLTFLIWDIMGQKGFRALLKEAYFDGALLLKSSNDFIYIKVNG